MRKSIGDISITSTFQAYINYCLMHSLVFITYYISGQPPFKVKSLNHDDPQVTMIITSKTILSHYKATKLQECLESGLERGLGFDIREGDMILGNFEEINLQSTTENGQLHKVSCHFVKDKYQAFQGKDLFCDVINRLGDRRYKNPRKW